MSVEFYAKVVLVEKYEADVEQGETEGKIFETQLADLYLGQNPDLRDERVLGPLTGEHGTVGDKVLNTLEILQWLQFSMRLFEVAAREYIYKIHCSYMNAHSLIEVRVRWH
jgi:hypothetical protein